MRADIVLLSELSAAEREAWTRLAAEAVSPNPFAEPDFVLPAARGLAERGVGVLFVREGAEWLAATPVRHMRSWRGVPGRCLAIWRHPYCFLGTPLVARKDPEATLAALIGCGLDHAGALAFDWIDAAGPLKDPLSAALASRARVVVLERFERASLRRRPDSDYLEHALGPHHRRELRRMSRRLAEQLGELTISDRSGDASAYEQFLALEESGWKGAAGTALACNPHHAAFFRELCVRFAAAGRLELLSLGAGGRPAAMLCNLSSGGAAFSFKIAFDERLARLSPGTQLLASYTDHFHAGEHAWADSCAAAENVMIKRLWTGRRQLASVVATRRGPSGALPYAKWRAAAEALPMRRKITTRRQGDASGH